MTDYFGGNYGVGADPLTGLPVPVPGMPGVGAWSEADANAFRHGFNDPRWTGTDPLSRIRHGNAVEAQAHAARTLASIHHANTIAAGGPAGYGYGFPMVPHGHAPGTFPMAHGSDHAHREERLRRRERELEHEHQMARNKRHHRSSVEPEYEDAVIGADSGSAIAAGATGVLVSTPVVDMHVTRLIIPSGYGANVGVNNFQIGMRIFNATGTMFSGMSFSEQSRIMLPLDFGVVAAGTQILTTITNLGTAAQRFVFSYHGRDKSRHCAYGPDARQMRHEGYYNHPHGGHGGGFEDPAARPYPGYFPGH